MIKLKPLLEQNASVYKNIPTKYPDALLSLIKSPGTTRALKGFSPEQLKDAAQAFDAFVEKNSVKKVTRKGKMIASLDSVKNVTEKAEREPLNISLEIDVSGEFAEAKTNNNALNNSMELALSNTLNEQTDKFKSADSEISNIEYGLVTYQITATTSRVGSEESNQALRQKRYETIKDAFIKSANTLNIAGVGVAGEADPILTPSGPDMDRKYSLEKRKADPKLKAEYEKIYGPHRRAFITIQLDVKLEYKSEPEENTTETANVRFEFSTQVMPKSPRRSKRKFDISIGNRKRIKNTVFKGIKNKFQTTACPVWK